MPAISAGRRNSAPPGKGSSRETGHDVEALGGAGDRLGDQLAGKGRERDALSGIAVRHEHLRARGGRSGAGGCA